MTTRFYQLPKERWEEFFDDFAGLLVTENKRVDIEVTGLSIGDQTAAEHLPLNGLTYEPKSDTFFIYSDGSGRNLDHSIAHPKEIWVELGPTGLSRVVVKEEGDQQQFIVLREPLALPPAVEDELRMLPR